MLSEANKLHFMVCNLLYGALQLYYEYPVSIPEHQWAILYEDLVEWLLKEFEFYDEWNSLSENEEKQLIKQGERAGDEAFQLFNENHIAESEFHQWIEFCLWIEKVLEKFEYISKLDVIKNTIYEKRFRTSRFLVIKLKTKLKRIYLDAQSKIPEAMQAKLLASANLMADKWHDLTVKWVKKI